jgi:DNA polymerase III epsilon subunit-like protein
MARYTQKNGGLDDMVNDEQEYRKPRILTIDLETTPIQAYTWGPKWETNLIDFVEHSQILSYSAKWYGGKQDTKGLCDYTGYKPGKIDDKQLVKEVHSLIDAADIVVTQNGIDFDMKILNTRFLKHGMSPPSPYKNVDTKREVKKYFRLPSNSLNDIGQYFGLGKKLEHEGFPLWLRCMAGDMKAWTKMKKYNAQDVALTEKVYEKLLPYMKTHPNIGMYTGGHSCGKCGSSHLQKRGYERTTASVFQRLQCFDCGGWSRESIREQGHKVLANI